MKFFLLLFLMIFPFHVYADNDCNEASPNFIKNGDKYYEIEETKLATLTKEQLITVKKIFAPLRNSLKGTGTTMKCVGEENNQTKVNIKEKLRANIDVQSDGKILIDIEIFEPKSREEIYESLNFFGDNNNYTLTNLTKNSISLVYKWRVRRGNGAVTLYERIIKLTVKNRVLHIHSTHYLNGYFGVFYKRELH